LKKKKFPPLRGRLEGVLSDNERDCGETAGDANKKSNLQAISPTTRDPTLILP